MLENGCGIAQNYVEAAQWFTKAADEGLAEAQFKLGTMYENGRGVAKNTEVAAKWYKEAAEQDYLGP
jgi:TPR repeat protein